jgi:hypothetical protein
VPGSVIATNSSPMGSTVASSTHRSATLWRTCSTAPTKAFSSPGELLGDVRLEVVHVCFDLRDHRGLELHRDHERGSALQVHPETEALVRERESERRPESRRQHGERAEHQGDQDERARPHDQKGGTAGPWVKPDKSSPPEDVGPRTLAANEIGRVLPTSHPGLDRLDERDEQLLRTRSEAPRCRRRQNSSDLVRSGSAGAGGGGQAGAEARGLACAGVAADARRGRLQESERAGARGGGLHGGR